VKTRILAGLIGLAVILPLIFWGGVAGVTGLVGVALAVSIAEYVGMVFPEDRFGHGLWFAFGAFSSWLGILYAGPQRLMLFAPALFIATWIVCTLRTGGNLVKAQQHLGDHLVGFAWFAFGLSALVQVAGFEQGPLWVVFTLIVAWAGDTGAYFAGRSLGRRKLYPLVSPKKTWEGAIGGVLSVVLFASLYAWAVGLNVPLVHAAVMGAVGCSLGILGDLGESLLKRSHGVKDSGWILPGHGGILDRIDSLLFVAPFVYSYAVVSGLLS